MSVAPEPLRALSTFTAQAPLPKGKPAAEKLGQVEEGEERGPSAKPAPSRSSSRAQPQAQKQVQPQPQKQLVPKQGALVKAPTTQVSSYNPTHGRSPSVDGESRGWVPVDVFEFKGTTTTHLERRPLAAGGSSSRVVLVELSPAAEERVQRAETLDPEVKRKEILRLRAELEKTKAAFPTLKKAVAEREYLTPELEQMYTQKVSDLKKNSPVMNKNQQVMHPRLAGTKLVPLFYSKSMITKICIVALKRRKQFDTLPQKKGPQMYEGDPLFPYPTGPELERWINAHLNTIWGNPDFCSEIDKFHTDVIGQNLALRDPNTMEIVRTSNDFHQTSDVGKADLDTYLKNLRERLNLINKTISEFERPGVMERPDETFLGKVLPTKSKAQLKEVLTRADYKINQLLRQFRRDHPSGEISESLYNSLSAIASYGTITVLVSAGATGAAAALSPYARAALIRAITSTEFAQFVGTTYAMACPGIISRYVGEMVTVLSEHYGEISGILNVAIRKSDEIREDIYQCIGGVFFAAADEEPPAGVSAATEAPSRAMGGLDLLTEAVEKMGEKVTDICWVYDPRGLAFAHHDEAAIAWGRTLHRSLKELDREKEEEEAVMLFGLLNRKGGARNTKKYKKHSAKRTSRRLRK
jgi:hypothetical protein